MISGEEHSWKNAQYMQRPEARVSGCVRGSHQAGMAGVLVWSVSHCTDIY